MKCRILINLNSIQEDFDLKSLHYHLTDFKIAWIDIIALCDQIKISKMVITELIDIIAYKNGQISIFGEKFTL